MSDHFGIKNSLSKLIMVSLLCVTGCQHFSVRSLEWKAELTHQKGLGEVCDSLEAVAVFEEEVDGEHQRTKVITFNAGCEGDTRKETYEVHRANNRQTPGNWWTSIDIPSLVTVPFWLLYDVGRLVFVEDADSVFKATRFDTYVMAKEEEKDDWIQADEPIEIVVRSLLVDNFTEGRLRDSLGGNGGQVSLQATLNALSPQGRLLVDDRAFLLVEEAKRRSPFLTALQATEEGREIFADVKKATEDVVSTLQNIQAILDNVEKQIREYSRQAQELIDAWIDPDDPAQIEARVNELVGKLRTLVKENKKALTEALLTELIKVGFPDERMLRVILDRLCASAEDRLEAVYRTVSDRTLAAIPQLRTNAVNLAANADRLAQGVRDHALAAGAVLTNFFERFGVDEEGLYEKVEIIKGLASADRYMSMEFESLRPAALAIDEPGTAEIAFCGNENGVRNRCGR